jgi:tetratricopeptide (TPR) repeat protein
VADSPRIEELRRRVARDPASIAFAQLAEEYRRAGDYPEAIRVCREGLAQHPGYLSARVTLGRALAEIKAYDDAQAELEHVLRGAPDNLAAIRALADIHQRRGHLDEALKQFSTAQAIARDEPPLPDFTRALAAINSMTLDLPVPSSFDAALDDFAPRDPVVEELEHWLDAIVADRRARAS